ncbi:hypothetical protein L6164_017722 [Bauhinia variegata]|uniref:Uncharacterized protein n=1 Tax=Bauhinia variegata TaxID=167791 RepID=A0ACB9NAN9_BAUVA|nr:hypothetical protein L6164_017722 [Bauhinia variegata]
MLRLSSAFCLLMLVPFVFGMGAVTNESEDSRCGPDGPPIRFPFQLKGSNSSNQCGYPGFDLLSCTKEKETVLELPLPEDPVPARFYISYIDYKAQEISVYNPREEHCISRELLKLARSRLLLFRYYPYKLTFFNCSLSSSPCRIRVVDSGTDVSEQVSCTKMRDVLLPGTSIPQYQGFFSTDGDYSYYFRISWTKPNCTRCQKPGQKCQFIDNEIQCISTKHRGLSIKAKKALGSILLVMILIAIVLALRAYKLIE